MDLLVGGLGLGLGLALAWLAGRLVLARLLGLTFGRSRP